MIDSMPHTAPRKCDLLMVSAPPVPTTKVAKERMRRPSNWAPLERMRRVDEMLRASPKTVVTRSMVGKMEKSVAFLV